jgi:class 3 adenylate cyclase
VVVNVVADNAAQCSLSPSTASGRAARGEHIGRRFPRDVGRPSAGDPLRDVDPRRRAVARHLGVRAGLHTGECEVRGDDIGEIAVHIGARVSALAGANDVLASSTLRDLVIGSGLEFEDRGNHELKGVPGEWHLFAVTSS